MGRKKSKKADFEFNAIESQPEKKVPIADAKTAKNDYLEILRHEKKQKNGLLGTFDTNGKYKISDENIFQSLLNVPKKFQEKVDNIVYASAQKDNLIINFKIELDLNVDFSSATLYLIEIEHGVEEDVKHITELDHFLNVHSATFIDEAFKAWKVWREEDVYEKDDFLFEYLKRQKEDFLFNRELTEILSQLYLVRMLKTLEMCGEVGQKILLEYKLMIESRQNLDPAFKQSNTALKEILDFVLLKENAIDEVLKTQAAAIVMAGYAEPLKRIKDKAPVLVEVTLNDDKKEKQPEKKSEAKKSKPKAKAKSSDSAPKLYKFDAGKAFKSSGVGGVNMPKLLLGERKFLIPPSPPTSLAQKQKPADKEKITENPAYQTSSKNQSISSLRASVGLFKSLGESASLEQNDSNEPNLTK